MSFVYEEVKEEDYKKFKSFDLINPYTHKQPSIGYWTVDKTRDIYLIKVGTGSGILELQPEYFVLIWNEQKIPFEGYYTMLESEKYWDITLIQVPDVIKDNKTEIYEVVKEALMVNGVYGKAVVKIDSFPEIELEKSMELKSWKTLETVLTLIGFCLIFIGFSGFMMGPSRGSMVVIENNKQEHSLNEKCGIAVDSDGNIYIGAGEADNIQVYDSTGVFQYGFSFPTNGGSFDFGIEQDKIHVVTARSETYFVFNRGKLVSSEKGIDYNRSKELRAKYHIKLVNVNSYETSSKKYKISLFNTVIIQDKESGQVEKIHLNAPFFPLPIVVYWLMGVTGMGLIFVVYSRFFASTSR